MDLAGWARMMAQYNRVANERLFDSCDLLDDAEYRRQRQVSFGSIHGLLNHLLLGDRIWMARFAGKGHLTPPLNMVLFAEFAPLRTARIEEDARIEAFFAGVTEEFFERSFAYRNNQNQDYAEAAPVAIAHFFNHQTHHRGQLHAMLAQTGVAAPTFDLHRIINP
jgi:uncharacterized damage-inducible protein DinB